MFNQTKMNVLKHVQKYTGKDNIVTQNKEKPREKSKNNKPSVEVVKIAEKVKFWEEQDRINNAIIPRVMKNHDLLTELSKNIEGYSSRFIELDQQNTENNNRYDALNKSLTDLERCLSDYQSNIKKSDTTSSIMKWTPTILASIALVLAIIALLR